MAHTLPQRPSFLPAPPEPSISLALEADLDLLAAPVPSSSTSTSCSICASPPKYTCPGCSRKSCSLTCSKTHKEKFQCDGKRDITAYVPLKEVNEGVWSDDYRWLEESRRKVAQWGETLPPGAAAQMQIGDQRGNKRQNFKRKRGGGNGGGAQGVLEGELEKRGIMVEFMPDGMDRRKKNQSSYNIQQQTMRLTVQLVLSDELKPPNGSNMVNHPRVAFPPPSGPPATLPSLLPAELGGREDLVCVLPYHTSQHEGISSIPGQRFFPPLSTTLPLIDALRGTSFVEFPIVRVFTQTEWNAKVKRGEVVVLPLLCAVQPSSPVNRQRVDHSKPSATTPHLTGPFSSVRQLDKSVSLQVPASPIPPKQAAPTISLGLGLGDYDSDEEDEEAVDEAA